MVVVNTPFTTFFAMIIILYWRLVVHITSTIAQHKSTKKWLAIAHFRIGVCTRPTLIGAKHFNRAATVTSTPILIHGCGSGREMKAFQRILSSMKNVIYFIKFGRDVRTLADQ